VVPSSQKKSQKTFNTILKNLLLTFDQIKSPMKKFFKMYTLIFMLTSNFKLFAGNQPGDSSDDGDLEDDETPVATYSKLMILMVMGLLLVFNKFQNLSKNKPILIIAPK
jgi:hypothetical protein